MLGGNVQPTTKSELILVFGAGGHGKVVADALSLQLSEDVDGFVDDNQAFIGSYFLDYPVRGDHRWLWNEARRRPVAVALGIGDGIVRQRIMEQCLENGIRVLTVVHPSAIVATSATVGTGSVVFARAVLNPHSCVGRGVIINTAAIIEHDVEIGDFTHIAPLVATGGAVRIGQHCQVGLSAQIHLGVVIGDQTIIGSGAVVRQDLPRDVVAVGIPARILPHRTEIAEHSDSPQLHQPAAPSRHAERIYLSAPHTTGQEQAFILEALESNWIAPAGPHLDLFEAEFARRVGLRHAVAVSSGTAAMHLAIRHLNLQPDEEVFCSTGTFAASVNPVMYERGHPVFIDSDPATWNIDCNLLAEELERCAARGKLPRAVIAVDLYGQCADWSALQCICGFYEVPLIDDAAEALEAAYDDKPAGSFGWANVFSFNGNKIITTSGGGMLATNDAALATTARYFSTQARDPVAHYEHSAVGFNYRMSNLLAGVGRAQLQALDQRVAGRRANCEFYREALADVAGISFMPEATYGRCTRWLTCIVVDPNAFGATREEIRLHLEGHNIESRAVWKPMHLQPVFKDCRYVGGTVAERLFEDGLCLPSGTSLTPADLQRVVSALLSVPRRRANRRVSIPF